MPALFALPQPGAGIVVLSSISGIHTPEKMGRWSAWPNRCGDENRLVSQAEREVMIQKIKECTPSDLMETNALQGTPQPAYDLIENSRTSIKKRWS